jgi:hypothetical protein
MSARLRAGSLFSGVRDACMNLPFFVFGSGLCGPSLISSADEQFMPWVSFPRKPFFWEPGPKYGERGVHKAAFGIGHAPVSAGYCVRSGNNPQI